RSASNEACNAVRSGISIAGPVPVDRSLQLVEREVGAMRLLEGVQESKNCGAFGMGQVVEAFVEDGCWGTGIEPLQLLLAEKIGHVRRKTEFGLVPRKLINRLDDVRARGFRERADKLGSKHADGRIRLQGSTQESRQEVEECCRSQHPEIAFHNRSALIVGKLR